MSNLCDDCQRGPCICMLGCADDEAAPTLTLSDCQIRRAVSTFVEHGGCDEYAHAVMREKAMRAALLVALEQPA